MPQKPAARQEGAAAPGVGRVEKDDVEVARQSAVLESVVEDEYLAVELLDGRLGQRGAVGALQVRHVGEVLLEDERLVVAADLGAVAAAEDADAAVESAIKASDELHHRRL